MNASRDVVEWRFQLLIFPSISVHYGTKNIEEQNTNAKQIKEG